MTLPLTQSLTPLADFAAISRTLSDANNCSLAEIIAALINENEPLLKAEHGGTTVTVRERGGPGVMIVTVETQGGRSLTATGE